MKKKHHILLLISFILIFSNCGSIDPNIAIEGSWKLDNIEISKSVDNPDNYIKALNQVKNSTQLNFLPDKTFSGKIWGDTTFGTWKIDQQTNQLTLFDSSTKVETVVEIEFQSNTQMSLTQNDTPEKLKLNFVK